MRGCKALFAFEAHSHMFFFFWNESIFSILQVSTESRPGAMGPPSTSHFTLVVDTPKGFAPYTPQQPIDVSAVACVYGPVDTYCE